MARTGRPKIENPRKHSVTVRFNDDEYARFMAYAEKFGLNITEVVQKSLDNLYALDDSSSNSRGDEDGDVKKG